MFHTPAILSDGPDYVKPGNLAQNTVLTTIQASHADVTLTTGLLAVTGGISIKLVSVTNWSVVAYNAGQVQVTGVNMASIAVSDNTTYNISIMTLADNAVYPLQVISGTGATVASIVAQMALQINNNQNLPVTAVAVGNTLVLTEQSTTTGGFQVVTATGAVIANGVYLTLGAITGTYVVGETVTQATSGATGVVITIALSPNVMVVYNTTGTFDATHVVTGGTSGATSTPSAVVNATDIQPSGIPAQVGVYAGAPVTGTYQLYAISYNASVPNSGISGNLSTPSVAYIWANTGSANFSAFDTFLQNILNGTHTPASDYLGAA